MMAWYWYTVFIFPVVVQSKTAVCVVGGARTFMDTYMDMKNTLTMSATKANTTMGFFFWVSNSLGNDSAQTLYRPIPEKGLQAAINAFQPVFSTIRGETPFVKNDACGIHGGATYSGWCNRSCPKHARWWETFMEIKKCMQEITKAEKRQNMTQATVARIRPDVIFYDVFPPVWNTNVPVFPHASTLDTYNEYLSKEKIGGEWSLCTKLGA